MAAGSFAGQAASSIIVAFFLPCMLVLVQRRAETIVVALCFAFGWLVGISVAGVVFVSGLSGDRAVLASVGAVSSELGRFLVHRGYRAVEKLELADECFEGNRRAHRLHVALILDIPRVGLAVDGVSNDVSKSPASVGVGCGTEARRVEIC